MWRHQEVMTRRLNIGRGSFSFSNYQASFCTLVSSITLPLTIMDLNSP